jgi:hypothetical protein
VGVQSGIAIQSDVKGVRASHEIAKAGYIYNITKHIGIDLVSNLQYKQKYFFDSRVMQRNQVLKLMRLHL